MTIITGIFTATNYLQSCGWKVFSHGHKLYSLLGPKGEVISMCSERSVITQANFELGVNRSWLALVAR